jgi:hypothetical protein
LTIKASSPIEYGEEKKEKTDNEPENAENGTDLFTENGADLFNHWHVVNRSVPVCPNQCEVISKLPGAA